MMVLSHPGRTDQGPSARWAFADTTLLRDTLSLHFDRLFPLADSLGVAPDTLRALSIRYRLTIERIVHLADSLRAPIDSVGAIMLRERFNPLATSAQQPTHFTYSTGYNISRQTTTWSNDTDYRSSFGSLLASNTTSIQISRTNASGGATEVNKSKSSRTQLDWKLTPGLSMGVQANLQGNESFSEGSIYNQSVTNNEYQFAVRSKQRLTRWLSSSFNALGGPFGQPNSSPEKKGFSGTVDGQATVTWSTWLTHDLTARTRGQFGRARLTDQEWLRTIDSSSELRGALGLWSSRPVAARVDYSLRRDQLQYPALIVADTMGVYLLRTQPTSNDEVTFSVQMRRGSNNYVNLSQKWGRGRGLIQVGTRLDLDHRLSNDRSLSADGHGQLRGWSLESHFTDSYPQTDTPAFQQLSVGGQPITVNFRERDDVTSRSVDARLSKSLTSRILFQASGAVSLVATRPQVTDSSYRFQTGTARVTTIRAPRDDYRQSYKLEGSYVRSERMTTGISLEVTRVLGLNLLSSGSSSNTETRSFNAEWHWNFRLLPGLTATQRNQMLANYLIRPFAANDDRLSLDYLTTTTLDATVTPRLRLQITHNARIQPSGDYKRSDDGLDYFSLSDEGRDYTLSGRISYSPAPAIQLSLDPYYHALTRRSTLDGRDVPTSAQRDLNLNGSANLNVQVSKKGQLTGYIGRNFVSTRSTRYPNGIAVLDPRTENDFWNGSLQFTWQL
jgi:hypothetical protein